MVISYDIVWSILEFGGVWVFFLKCIFILVIVKELM